MKLNPIKTAKSNTATIVTCTFCDTELELDNSEIINRQFICPNCSEETYLEDSIISELDVSPNKLNKIEITDQEWFGMWVIVALLLSIAIYIFIKSNDGALIISLALIVLGFIQIYRILNTGKLILIPDTNSIDTKINIARKIQDKMHWDIIERKGNYYVFRDKYFYFDHEITFICSEAGYYIHCMSTNPNLDGVSLTQTWRVKKVIRELSRIS